MQTVPRLAAELVQMNVNVVCAFGDLAPRLVQEATQTIPIIAITDDILGAGLVGNLSRPGANLTGLTILSPELSAKRLQVLKSVSPSITRVATLTDPTTGAAQVSLTSNAAQFLNVDLQLLEVRRGDDLPAAFETAKANGAEALNVFSSPLLSSLSALPYLPRSSRWQRNTSFQRFISGGSTLRREVLSLMDPILARCGDNVQSCRLKSLRGPVLLRCR
jgi:putative ABC transport system substrate-binding protein